MTTEPKSLEEQDAEGQLREAILLMVDGVLSDAAQNNLSVAQTKQQLNEAIARCSYANDFQLCLVALRFLPLDEGVKKLIRVTAEMLIEAEAVDVLNSRLKARK